MYSAALASEPTVFLPLAPVPTKEGWRYTFHYGALSPGPGTLEDGTIRRYDNAHEKTKGHERHVAPDPEPETVEFPGIEELYERFWNEIPKPRFGPSTALDSDSTHNHE